MATLQIRANKSSALLERISDGLRVGAGQDDHLPVASSWSDHRERSVIGFSVPASTWADMAAVSKVELVLRSTGSGVHVGRGSSPACKCRRLTESWSPNSASMDGGGSANTTGLVYPGPAATTTYERTITYSGSGGDVDVTEDITAMARVWMPSRLGGSGAACYGVRLEQTTSTADISEFYSAEVSTESWRPTLVITYTPLADGLPSSPSLVSPAGTLVPADTFAFTFGQAVTSYDLDVSTDKTFATVTHWHTGVNSSGLAGDGKSVSVAYGGTALAYATPTYWWRARGRNAAGVGAWAAAVSFTVDASGGQGDQLDAWADHVIAELATPRRHTILGTVVPQGADVLAIASTDYAGRWYIHDANHGAEIATVVELVGMTVHADGTSGWSIDATTHDIGGPEAVPPDAGYTERVLSGEVAPIPTDYWQLGDPTPGGSWANSVRSFVGYPLSGTYARGISPLAGTDGALGNTSVSAQIQYGNLYGTWSRLTVAGWLVWNGAGELYLCNKLSDPGTGLTGWRAQVTTDGRLRAYACTAGVGPSVSTAAGAIAPGRAYHVAFVLEAPGEARMYIDGVRVFTGTLTSAAGYDATFNLRTMINGTVDELGLWLSVLLTDAEILALYRRI